MSKKENKAPLDCNDFSCRLGAVGGQAVLEGVMMRHKNHYSIAARKEDGSIVVCNKEHIPFKDRCKFFGLPIVRGVVNMIESMVLSIHTLDLSAEMTLVDENAPKEENEKPITRTLLTIVMFFSTILGLALGAGLFLFLPSFLTKLLDNLTGEKLGFWKNIIEGLIKITIFISYMLLVSLMKDIRRTFEYHGAEHKSIFCFEAGEELTPENVKKYSRFHPRCGTSFIFVILIIGVFFSSLPIVPWDNILLRFAVKLGLLVPIVGIGYEFIKYAGTHDNVFVKILSAPGLFMQRITTREPDSEEIEVAIHALKASLPQFFPDYVCPSEYIDPADKKEDKSNE